MRSHLESWNTIPQRRDPRCIDEFALGVPETPYLIYHGSRYVDED